MRKTLVGLIVRYLSSLRFPRLFALVALLFVADLALPDVIPLVDEILLGLGAALLGSWKERRKERRLAASDGEDEDEGERELQEGSRDA